MPEPGIAADHRQLRPYQRPAYEAPAGSERRVTSFAHGSLSAYNHDGFYLRLAGGCGGGTDRLEGSRPDYGFTREHGRRGRIVAFGVPTEVAVGGTLARGLVVGAGVYASVWPVPEAEAKDSEDYEFVTSQLALFAPMVDFYPWPHRGWHLQGAFGIASFNMGFGTTGYNEPRPAQAHVGTGAGFMLGAGRDWFIAEEWSLGVLVRSMLAWSSGTDSDGGAWTHRSATYDGLITLTRH